MWQSLLALVLLAVLVTPVVLSKQILMVQTLTRHGTRAPDKIVGQKVCRPIIDPEGGSVHKAFVEVFGTGAAELTSVGVRQMRDVGSFLRERYHGFLWTDYAAHSKEWEFIAREGTRQQRSMMGLVQGIFPDDAVPISVTRRETDAVLGGPAPQCAAITHDYILEWHRTKGSEIVKQNYHIIKPLETVCNVSLIHDPVNSIPGGANPHAYIGDISDLMDSLYEANREPLPISAQQHLDLTSLAFALEQGAHFAYPGGAVMHAGAFPDRLLSAFEEIEANGGTRPEKLPKMRMHTCSRELHYGLSQMFGWMDKIRIPGQPVGRIRAGTTFIWELHSDMKIRAYYYQYPANHPEPLAPPMTIQEYRDMLNKSNAKCGSWSDICIHKQNKCVDPLKNPAPGSAAGGPEALVASSTGSIRGTASQKATPIDPVTIEPKPQGEPGLPTPPESEEAPVSRSVPFSYIIFALLVCGAIAVLFRQSRRGYAPV